MLTEFFESPLRIREVRGGPFGPLLEGFAQELCRVGYARITARRHIRAAEHFSYWTDRKGIPVAILNESSVDRFGRHLDRCRCPGYGHTHLMDLKNAACLFLAYLRDAGAVTTLVAGQTTEEPVLLTAFRQWMRQQRGTCDGTLDNYSLSIRDLLKTVGEDPRRFDSQNLRKFVLERSQRSGWAIAKKCTTALRMFLRFLIAEDKCAVGLDAAIPVLAHWRLSSLPRYLQSEEVERVIAACDPTSPVGRRDRAILLLLARLGLRAGDIVQLRLGNIDWKEAGIHVCGKGHHQTRLPLTQEVGNARRTASDRHRYAIHPIPCSLPCLCFPFCSLGHCRSGTAPVRRDLPQPRFSSCPSSFRGNLHVAARSIAAGHRSHPPAPFH